MNTPIAFAAGGGLIVNLLQLVEYGKLPRTERPDFSDWLFYVPYLVWPIAGAILACAYVSSGVTLSPILALNVGISAPLILRAMASANPLKSSVIDPGAGA